MLIKNAKNRLSTMKSITNQTMEILTRKMHRECAALKCTIFVEKNIKRGRCDCKTDYFKRKSYDRLTK